MFPSNYSLLQKGVLKVLQWRRELLEATALLFPKKTAAMALLEKLELGWGLLALLIP